MRKISLWSIGLALALFLSSASFAAPNRVTKTSSFTREEVYTPSKEECRKSDTCDLKQVIFRVQDIFMPKEDKDDIALYWTKMYASYVTNALSSIEKYAFVQFIRGCVFTSEMLPGGEVVTHLNVIRRHMDTPEEPTLFRHLDWVIDSEDADPVYSSGPGLSGNRHFFLQWTTPPGDWDPDLAQGNLYGEERPKLPQVYVTDFPMPARHDPDGSVRNSSLEFRVCLYKTADVPLATRGSDINFAAPIRCFEWNQSFVYNHEKNSWERPTGVVAECKRPFTKEEEKQLEALKYRPKK